MIDQALQKLIEFLQNASPVFWQTIIKQVYSEAAFRLVWAFGLIIACIVLVKVIKWIREREEYTDEFVLVMCFIGAIGSGIVAFGMIISAIMWLINPQFYAIRWIMESLIK